MSSLQPDLVARIRRLPKPRDAAAALQPLFEAVSNAIHSTQDKFGADVARKGRVSVSVDTDRQKAGVRVVVRDNGMGLDERNWRAFTTMDTAHKLSRGGKGVGRLLWLDCFERIEVASVFRENGAFKRRSFGFALSNDGQIDGLKTAPADGETDSWFEASFEGLAAGGYRDKFPGRGFYVFQHMISHFLPVFIGNGCPVIEVRVDKDRRRFPDRIDDVIHRKETISGLSGSDYGTFDLTLMECSKVASTSLDGKHHIHFVAHERAVVSRKIDNKLGLGFFGDGADRVLQAVLSGEFLDSSVNQERTAFQFKDADIEKLIGGICIDRIEDFLEGPLATVRLSQEKTIETITETYPSVRFGDMDELRRKIPSGELSDDAIYGHLSRERYRRDRKQASRIRSVFQDLKESAFDLDNFHSKIEEAREAIEDAEQRSLTEYVVRRKVVLDFMDLLLEKVRDDTRDSSYAPERALHSFICPMRTATIGNGGRGFEAASHDLWIVDERLTFAQYFSSDVPFSQLSSDTSDRARRPDLLVFDRVHGLRASTESSKVLLVEFKRPGRTSYRDNEEPLQQVQRYVFALQSGELRDVRGRPIKLDRNTAFYCFIVADIVGKLYDWTRTWDPTPDGRGRIYTPRDGFQGFVEVMGWDSLMGDAKQRNQAFFDKAGITGESFFSPES